VARLSVATWIILVTVQVGPVGDSTPMKVPDFIENVKAAARALDTMEVSYRYQKRSLDDDGLLAEGSRRLAFARHEGWGRWEDIKTYKPENLYIDVGPKGFAFDTVAQAFNGDFATRLTAGGPAGQENYFDVGDIQASPHAVVRELLTREATTLPGYYGCTVRRFTDAGWDLIAEAEGVTVERVVEDGHDCFLLSFPWGTKPSTWGHRIWFDAERGLAPHKIEMLAGATGEEVYTRVEIPELDEAAPGVWLPATAVRWKFKPGRTEKTTYTLAEGAKVGGTIDRDVFTIDFPPGTDVTDKRTGAHYKVGVQDDELEAMAEDVERSVDLALERGPAGGRTPAEREEPTAGPTATAGEPSSEGARSGLVPVLVAACALLLAGAAIWLWLRRGAQTPPTT